jgi:hypothetical protein
MIAMSVSSFDGLDTGFSQGPLAMLLPTVLRVNATSAPSASGVEPVPAPAAPRKQHNTHRKRMFDDDDGVEQDSDHELAATASESAGQVDSSADPSASGKSDDQGSASLWFLTIIHWIQPFFICLVAYYSYSMRAAPAAAGTAAAESMAAAPSANKAVRPGRPRGN